MSSKEALIKEIISIRRRLSCIPKDETRDIERFEEQLSKSLRRVDQASYIAKKFDYEELEQIKEAYQSL
ncbi:hypothetical protein [Cellulosilyticum ruminicola]|uniref:hypothetical protein n=1 Tax=Cellulosilyticum ruminicola TaxID=425254 RepID=UPI0006D122EA|nr:hypothetical protein [Cellulosilyticum ruminicola]